MSETTASEAQQLMGLDTVRIKSPYMARNIVDKVKAQGQSYCQVLNETGELLWEVTRTNLKGSYDSRIMVKPMYEDCQKSRAASPSGTPARPT